MDLAPIEKNRYLRQLQLSGWDESCQLKLKNSHVFIAGAGGLGSSSIFYLAAAGIGTLTICDHDRVDLSNLNRQIIHRLKNIGMLKVVSAGESVRELNDSVNVNLVSHGIESQGTEELIAQADLVLDCLDSFTSRSRLNEICFKLKKPLVHAGIAEFHGQATFIHTPDTPCLNCFLPLDEKRAPVQVLGATAGIMGSIQAMEAVKYLTGTGETLKNRLLFFDGREMTFSTVRLARNPHCTVCK